MFEKFTQKAIDVIQSAQKYASEFKHSKVTSAHILIGLVTHTKGVQAKILNLDKINFSKLRELVLLHLEQNEIQKNEDNIMFSKDARDILKATLDLSAKLNSKFITPQHLALVLLNDKNCLGHKIIDNFNIDEEKIIINIQRMIDKTSDVIQIHPENLQSSAKFKNINDFFQEKIISEILSNAQAKVTTSGYEIVGTEQIVQAILDNKEYKIVDILDKYSINSDFFTKKTLEIPSRKAEFENSEKQIIFTPNAFSALMLALDCAKEFGSATIMPEHIILGILKSKKGIAYQILSSMLPDTEEFEEIINKKMNDNIPETLAILRLARQIAFECDWCVVGTEAILLAILSYGGGIASDTLRKLGITLKDAKNEVRKLIKVQSAKTDVLNFSQRAKKVLEIAYETAKEHKKIKIKSENLLYGITKVEDCLAMKVLCNLGTDILEIRQGIKQELLGGMEL